MQLTVNQWALPKRGSIPFLLSSQKDHILHPAHLIGQGLFFLFSDSPFFFYKNQLETLRLRFKNH